MLNAMSLLQKKTFKYLVLGTMDAGIDRESLAVPVGDRWPILEPTEVQRSVELVVRVAFTVMLKLVLG